MTKINFDLTVIQDTQFKSVLNSATSYLVNVLMSYREGEGEAQRKFLMLDVVFVQKV